MRPARIARNLLLSLSAVCLTIMALEGLGFLLQKTKKKRPFTLTSFPGPNPREHGWLPTGNLQYVSREIGKGGKVLSETQYKLDSHRRRETFDPRPGKERKRFLAFYGCSFTVGESVKGDETFPSRLAALLPETRVYNYGFHGYGPPNVLWRLENLPQRMEIPETKGLGIYVFIDDQLRRAIGTMTFVNHWGARFPSFSDGEPESLRYLGNFDTAHPWLMRLYWLLGKSNFLAYFRIDVPPRFTEAHYRKVARQLKRIEQLFQRDFPGQPFAVALFPGSKRSSASLAPELRRLGVRVLDYSASEIFPPKEPPPAAIRNAHPTAENHAAFAALIREDIEKLLPR